MCQRFENNEVVVGWGGPALLAAPIKEVPWGVSSCIPLHSLALILQRNWRSESLSYLSKVTQLVNIMQLRNNPNTKNPSSLWVRSIWLQIPCFSHYVHYAVSLQGHMRDGSRSSKIPQAISMNLRCSPGFHYQSTPNTLKMMLLRASPSIFMGGGGPCTTEYENFTIKPCLHPIAGLLRVLLLSSVNKSTFPFNNVFESLFRVAWLCKKGRRAFLQSVHRLNFHTNQSCWN